MSGLLFSGARVLTPGGEWPTGWLATDDRRIARMGQGAPPPGTPGLQVDARGLTLLPGFVDVHVHGAVGVDVMDADPDGLRRMARFFARHGVTAWCPTTWTGSERDTLRALEAVAEVAGPVDGGATVLGAHLEGPFLNPARCGAQDRSLIRVAGPAEVERLLASGVVRLLAVAPEVEGNAWLVAAAAGRGVTVAAGHTDATYQQALRAVADGVRHVTHAFNAMRPLGHREPGMLGAALTVPELTCELIADNVHVHPAVMRLLLRAKGSEGVVLVTDAVRAAGLPDGAYELGDRQAIKIDGAIRLGDGTLAGSVLTLDRALHNLQAASGRPLAELWPATSRNAVRALGLDAATGSLAPGKDADLVLLGPDLEVVATVVQGEIVHGAERLPGASARVRSPSGDGTSGRAPPTHQPRPSGPS
ncbi:MAG TPA: N-acetylglucosamine-6-phosphate deacetylase [Actinomycetes bacterium]|jgi:N-acetylglucosamine-6-phosphate deacetylase|nr:N-acetylglucosamine-6-phosphate deacetylase [Actinomycetes bacterium]